MFLYIWLAETQFLKYNRPVSLDKTVGIRLFDFVPAVIVQTQNGNMYLVFRYVTWLDTAVFVVPQRETKTKRATV